MERSFSVINLKPAASRRWKTVYCKTACHVLLIAAFLIVCFPTMAQRTKPQFRHIDGSEGLSQSSVMCMAQTRNGFLWLGTQDGLNRYDGYRFLVFKHDPEDIRSLASDYILALYEDRDGRLWVGTDGGGLNLFNQKSQTFTRFPHGWDRPDGLSDGRVTSLLEDRGGRLWVGTSKGLNMLDHETGRFTRFVHDPQKENSLGDNRIRALLEDSGGFIWVGTENGLSRFNPRDNSFTVYKKNDPGNGAGLCDDTVLSLYESSVGLLWIGTENGLGCYDLKAGRFVRQPVSNDDLGLLSLRTIRAVIGDTGGVLWLGTFNGLVRFDSQLWQVTAYRHTPGDMAGLSHSNITSLLKTRSGDLWVGTFVGLNFLDRQSEGFITYNYNVNDGTGLTNPAVFALLEDRVGYIWVGTYSGLNRFDPLTERFVHFLHDPNKPDSLSGNGITSLIEDHLGDLWVGTRLDGLNRYDNENGRFVRIKHEPGRSDSLLSNEVFALYEDENDHLWVGTEIGLDRMDQNSGSFTHFSFDPENPYSLLPGSITVITGNERGDLWLGGRNGLVRLNTRLNNTITRYTHKADEVDSISENRVLSILIAPDGVVWAGTFGGGLNRLEDPVSGRFRYYREKDGLPNDTVYGVVMDPKGFLWVSTNNGLARFDPHRETFQVYDAHDGLQGNEFNSGASARTRNNILLFGGVNGFSMIDPDGVGSDSYAPPVVFTRFLLSHHEVRFSEKGPLSEAVDGIGEITLPPDQRSFGFEFAALHFSRSAKVRYAYKLDGFDRDWIYTDASDRLGVYTNVPPGDYVFRAKGTNEDGVWVDNEAAVAVHLKAPMWLNGWAYAFLVVLVGMAVLAYVCFYNRRGRNAGEETEEPRLDKLRKEILDNTTHELRTPLNGIIGIAESLLDGAGGTLNQKLIINLNMICASGKRLLGLVDNMMDFARLKGDFPGLNSVPVMLPDFVDHILAGSRTLIGNKEVVFENNLGQKIPPVFADEQRLRQIFNNLIDNAVKFTEKGAVRISAETDSDWVTVCVSDTGIGIPQDCLELIFEPFRQSEGATSRIYGGAGLGLALARELVELHGGRIRAEVNRDVGSAFYFTLPIYKGSMAAALSAITGSHNHSPIFDTAPQNERDASKHTKPLSRPRILIVDDESVNQLVLSNHLKKKGYKLLQAKDGREALALLKTESVDLVLLDVMMPELSGFEVCSRIRDTYSRLELPIIFITARTEPEDMARGFESGGNDYMCKPINKHELLARVEAQLDIVYLYRGE